jgi:hypothetical protein
VCVSERLGGCMPSVGSQSFIKCMYGGGEARAGQYDGKSSCSEGFLFVFISGGGGGAAATLH